MRRLRQPGGSVKAMSDGSALRPISQPDALGRVLRLAEYPSRRGVAIACPGAFGCENGLLRFPVDRMAARWYG